MRDFTLSPEERGTTFLPWVSSYFPAVDSLDVVTPAILAARVPITDDTLPPSTNTMSPSELASCTHFGALASNVALRQVDPQVYMQNMRRALTDTRGVLGNVKAVVIWCDMSVVDCVWAAKAVADVMDETELGRIRRTVEFVKLESANHFVRALCLSVGFSRADTSSPLALGSLGRPDEADRCPDALLLVVDGLRVSASFPWVYTEHCPILCAGRTCERFGARAMIHGPFRSISRRLVNSRSFKTPFAHDFRHNNTHELRTSPV